MTVTLKIIILAFGYVAIAAAGFSLFSAVTKMGPAAFFKKLWHVTLLPEGALALLFCFLNFNGITATGHFTWWALRIALTVIQLFLLPKLMIFGENKRTGLGVICALLPLAFQILDNLIAELII